MNFAAGIRKTALATTIGAVALAATVGLGIDSASADNTGDGSGMTLVMFNADTGVGWYLGPDGESGWWGITSPDGSSTVYYIYYNPGDPNPDDPSSGEKGDSSMRQQLLKQLGGKLVMETPFGKTILGKELTASGQGLDPVWNPADVANGFEHDGNGGGSGGGGFDGTGGSIQSWLKNQAGKGGGSDADGDDPDKPGDVGIFGDEMPGPPELVNPNPVREVGVTMQIVFR